ncbi:condensation protein [Streptomyces sp. NPDC048644]|uniref:condensation protein n=1 Tax=Streptomyces sp. NPDC048644 TaxID=3365582 RepID=UPI00371B6017
MGNESPATGTPTGETPPASLSPSLPLPLPRLPFPVVDEIARHCLRDDEPETVHIEVHLPRRLDHTRLRAAFHQALTRHPRALVRQATARWWHRHYTWQLTDAPDVDPVAFPPPAHDTLARARQRALADCPPLHASPPVRLEVLESPDPSDGTVLLATLNHTALDAPAGLRILATTAALYDGADNSPAPPPARPSAPMDSRPLRTLTGTPALSRPTHIAPSHGPGHNNRSGSGNVADDSSTTAPHAPHHHTDLISDPGTANGMLLADLPVPARPPRIDGRPPWTVNDQLLVATWLMATRWNRLHGRPGSPVVITMPVDDRPRGDEMPIGNGTRLVPVGFGPQERRDADTLATDPPAPEAMARLLRGTAARTRALKSAPGAPLGPVGTVLTTPALPVGVRRALTRALRTAAVPWTSTTLLSNIGRVPYPLDFGAGGRPTAVWFSAPARMPRGLTVTTVSVGDRIQLTLRWSHTLLDAAAGARLGALFARCLAATSWPHPPPGPPPAPQAQEGDAR